jgi:mono/diheme cytochrome c family protein
MKNLYKQFRISFFAAAAAIVLLLACESKEEKPALTKEQMIERGKYLTTIASCQDCHSPKIMTPKGPIVDETRAFSGSPADMKLPKIDSTEITPGKWYLGSSDLTAWVGPWGVSFAANLTPDKATGSGAWTEELFVKILRSGKFMGADAGRPIMPPMPWEFINKMTDEDLKSIFAYLQSLPPISNSVPAYIPPNEIASMK